MLWSRSLFGKRLLN